MLSFPINVLVKEEDINQAENAKRASQPLSRSMVLGQNYTHVCLGLSFCGIKIKRLPCCVGCSLHGTIELEFVLYGPFSKKYTVHLQKSALL